MHAGSADRMAIPAGRGGAPHRSISTYALSIRARALYGTPTVGWVDVPRRRSQQQPSNNLELSKSLQPQLLELPTVPPPTMKVTEIFAVAIAMATVQFGEATPGDCTAYEMAMNHAYRRGDLPMNQLEGEMTDACGQCLYGDDDPCAANFDSYGTGSCGGVDYNHGCMLHFPVGASTPTSCESTSTLYSNGESQSNPNYYLHRCYKSVGDYNDETDRFGTESDDDYLVRLVGGDCMLEDTGTAANCANVVEMGAQLCVWDDQQTASQRCQVKGATYELLQYCTQTEGAGCGNSVAASERPAALQAILGRVNNAPSTGTRQPYVAPSPPPPPSPGPELAQEELEPCTAQGLLDVSTSGDCVDVAASPIDGADFCRTACYTGLGPFMDRCQGELPWYATASLSSLIGLIPGCEAEARRQVAPSVLVAPGGIVDCDDVVGFSVWSGRATKECCDEPDEVCIGGRVTQCNADCAVTVRQMHDACQAY
eukprot:SAG31_NODE_7619_length_1638_cov_1.980507_1_plen_482_part_10